MTEIENYKKLKEIDQTKIKDIVKNKKSSATRKLSQFSVQYLTDSFVPYVRST
jgi:hypothetical protein